MSENKMQKSALILGLAAAGCLLVVGLLFTWATALAVVLVELLLWLGYWLAAERLVSDRHRLERERAALDAEWDALDRTRRVRDVYYNARNAMRDEAKRYRPDGPDQQGQQ